jgi:hypothetical protein
MQLKKSIIIEASADRVWEYLRSPVLWNLFDDKVDQGVLTGGVDGRLGATYDMVRRMRANKRTTCGKIVALVPYEMIGLHETALDVNEPLATVSYKLNDLGTSTQVSVIYEIAMSKINVFWRMLIWIISRFGSAQEETALNKLKRIVETG